MTTAVDRLEKKGMVERRNDPADRRARVVHLTESGRKLISCAFADHEAAMERATSGLTPAERGQAVALLKKLGVRAEELL
jgi:MarR family transcriptional regulator, 2-MHQ and catechol-resistance regulon repressor